MAVLAMECGGKSSKVTVDCEGTVIRLEVISPEIIRVSAAPDGVFSERESLVVLPQEGYTDFTFEESDTKARLSTGKLIAEVDRKSVV